MLELEKDDIVGKFEWPTKNEIQEMQMKEFDLNLRMTELKIWTDDRSSVHSVQITLSNGLQSEVFKSRGQSSALSKTFDLSHRKVKKIYMQDYGSGVKGLKFEDD